MLYMVTERFKEGAAVDVYRRARERGRMLPEGLEYVDSWVEMNFEICYQLMQTENEALLREWTARWHDLVDFEVRPVRTSAEAFREIAPRIDSEDV